MIVSKTHEQNWFAFYELTHVIIIDVIKGRENTGARNAQTPNTASEGFKFIQAKFIVNVTDKWINVLNIFLGYSFYKVR